MKFSPSVRLLVAIIVFASLAGAMTNAQKSSQKDLDQIIKVARVLETDPFNKDAKKMREWSIAFVSKAPDITVSLCAGYLGPVLGSKYNYESELITQEIISMAAFIAEHQDKASDSVAVHQAGVEGVIKTYESILKTKPKAKMEYLDGLISKRDKGELKPYIEEISTGKCKPKS